LISFIMIVLDYKKLLKKENTWLLIAFIWFIVNYVNLYSGRLPFGFVPHRSWPFLAISVSIIVGYGMLLLASLLKSFHISKALTIFFIAAILIVTSAYPKYYFNTAIWPQHKLIPDMSGELGGYLWLNSLPIDTMVTSLCRADHEVISLDKMSTAQWDPEQISFKFQLINKSAEEISSFLRENKYQYAILDSKCVERFGINETNDKLTDMFNSGLFQPVLPSNIQGVIVFKLF